MKLVRYHGKVYALETNPRFKFKMKKKAALTVAAIGVGAVALGAAYVLLSNSSSRCAGVTCAPGMSCDPATGLCRGVPRQSGIVSYVV